MRFRLAEGVNLEDADGTMVFLVENGDAVVLDAVGGAIVNGLLGGDVDSCISRIARDYDVSSGEARRDVVEFKERLVALKLIEDAP